MFKYRVLSIKKCFAHFINYFLNVFIQLKLYSLNTLFHVTQNTQVSYLERRLIQLRSSSN